ncbi:MAG: hypothetical protein IPH08_13950 [Rhodocyclaceae bacterium]|nr:hypothetical protein [Rhodocyclaceae bacterium]
MAFTIEPDSTETSATPWQILVVDDDVSVHVATELTLKGIRHRDRRFAITRALSGAQAVQAVQDAPDRFDVVLMDVVMETPTAGIEAAEAIRKLKPASGLPGIILRSGQPGVYSVDRLASLHAVEEFANKSELNEALLREMLGKYLDIAQSCRNAVVNHATAELFRIEVTGPFFSINTMISQVRSALLASEWARRIGVPYGTLIVVHGDLSYLKEVVVGFKRELKLQRSLGRFATVALALVSVRSISESGELVSAITETMGEFGVPVSVFPDEVAATQWLSAATSAVAKSA